MALSVILSACTGANPPSTDLTVPSPSGPVASLAPSLPPGIPPTYAEDVPAADVPLKALIPRGTAAEGSWYATTPSGEAILAAFADPSQDPFRAERGFAIWRRFPDAPVWRAVSGQRYPPDAGVLSIQALIGDVTSDGVPDALVEALTGGSGTCGTWLVMDLTSGAELWRRDLCDADVSPSTDPTGLGITEAVYKPGDAHCCPSATRITVLTYAGDGRWTVVSRSVAPGPDG